MDFLNKASAQLKDLFQSMTPGSRITAGLLMAAVVISLGYLVTHEVPGSGVYLMGGEAFPPRELPAMEAAFAKAGLSGYEIEGGRIRVPRDQQHTYIAALAEGDALPHGFGDSLQRALDDGSVWDTNEQRQQRTKLGIQRELALTIGEMNGIDTARVFYDEQKERGWRQEVVRTASVSVRPMGSQLLDEALVPAIRSLVAGAVAGLKPEDVAVTDLNSGRVFRGGTTDGVTSAMDDPYLARKQFHEKHYKAEILEVLSYVHGAIVTCNVELDHEKIHRQEEVKHDPKTVPSQTTEMTSTRTSQGASPGGVAGYRGQVVTNASASLNTAQASGSSDEEELTESQTINALSSTRTETEMAAHPIERVTVAVAVPESYFKKVWEGRNPPDPAADGSVEPGTPDPTELEQIRTQEVANIRSCVAGYLPPPSDGTNATDLVTVTVFPDFKPQVVPEPPMTTAALSWFARNWSTLGLIGLALVSLLMLRSMIRSSTAPAGPRMPASAPGPAMEAEEADSEIEGESPEPDRRRRFNTSGASLKSELSDLVSSDPDTAANILRNWIGSPT